MYCVADELRNIIFYFNLQYKNHILKINTNYLITTITSVYEIAATDELHWKETGINFSILKTIIREIERTLITRDLVCLYDIVNYKLWAIIKKIFEYLFEKYNEELQSYFWEENKEALRKRYPDLLEYLDHFNEYETDEGVRLYGLRGRVIYRKNNTMERDLYSSYNPIEICTKVISKEINECFDKIYVWGFNGFEVDGLFNVANNGVKYKDTTIEVIITNLKECKQILKNTRRKNWLLNDKITWRYNVKIEEVLKEIEEILDDKVTIYFYINEISGDDYEKMKIFLKKRMIRSNLQL